MDLNKIWVDLLLRRGGVDSSHFVKKINTTNTDRFITSTFKKTLLILIPAPSISKVNAPSVIKKKTILKTFISRAKLQSSSRTIFLNELKNIKQTLINNGFPNYIVDTEIKHFSNKTKQYNIDNTRNYKQSINLYNKNQFHTNYKIDKHILKNLIQKNVLPTDPTKKIRLIIYYNKCKTSNLIISNNTSPSTELLDMTNVLYMFKCPLGDCVSKENNVYVGLTTTTLSRQLTMHFNDSSSIALHLKNQSIPKSKFRKILVENTSIIATTTNPRSPTYKNKKKKQIPESIELILKIATMF